MGMPSGRVYILVGVVVLTVGPSALSLSRSAGQEPAVGPERSTDAPAPSAPPGRLGPGSQAISGSNLENYKLLRYDEDYSYLKDPSRRTDPLDILKYIPLDDWGDDDYLSLGGTARPRFEFNQNPFFGSGPANTHGNNNDLVQRYMLHGDLHLGPNIRLFGQIQSGFENGLIGGPRPDIDVDVFDAHQAFMDLVWRWGQDESNSLTLRPGRQEMFYGSGRLIDVREGVNLRRSFDAARMLLKAGEWQVDGFWSKPVRNRPGVFDDDPNPHVSLWGVYAVHPLAVVPDGHADLYYLGYENDLAVYNQGTGRELRHSLGTRIWGRPMPWEYNGEYVWQFGTFGHGEIDAWTAASAVRYNFEGLPLSPRFGVRFDVASGDLNPRSPNLQTFNPLFPSGAYFNLANPTIGPQNIIDLHPVLDLNFGEKVTMTADWNFFWRESLDDGIYSLAGVPLRPGTPSQARYIGSSPSLTVAWQATRHTAILASYVHFFPGPYLQENPPAKAMDYVTVWIDFTF
ncbi:MAG: alginate export family protein [Planctomycetaceae bacterium]|nr:alginate export family protein [Planctomycetaceae bacterium]MBV8382601.1 alginate export family protein [Planctomycetaceae bacterium]MBV8677936.1 alginate export family protein [Planctomycetaceae bacterium]